MNNDKTWGSAFPREDYQTDCGRGQCGATMLDYFAVHAPKTPWPFFEPKMPPRPDTAPPMVGNDGEAPSEEETRQLRDWLQDPCYDIEDVLPQFSYWAKAMREYRARRYEWGKERDRQRLIQWPYFYAAVMVAQREEAMK